MKTKKKRIEEKKKQKTKLVLTSGTCYTNEINKEYTEREKRRERERRLVIIIQNQ